MPSTRRKLQIEKILFVKLERLSSQVLKKYNADVKSIRRRSLRILKITNQKPEIAVLSRKESENSNNAKNKIFKRRYSVVEGEYKNGSKNSIFKRRFSLIDPVKSSDVSENHANIKNNIYKRRLSMGNSIRCSDENGNQNHIKSNINRRRLSLVDSIKSNEDNANRNNSKNEIYKRKWSVVDPEKSEYVVEAIRSVIIFRNVLRFEVKWLYWDDHFNTFEPLQNLNCSNALKSFLLTESCKYKIEIETLIKELAVGPKFTESALKDLITKDVSCNEIVLQSYLLGLINNPKAKYYSKVQEKVEDLLQKKIFLDKRGYQMNALKDWENKMNEVDFKGKLRVINNVDFEGPPDNFTYVNANIPGDDVTIFNNPSIGCSCMPCGFKTNCCGKMHGSEYAYFAERRLKHTGIYIFECNKKCKCGPECSNRLVQKGRTNKLCIFKTSNGCGWGVKTDRHIKAGDFVCEYVGEIIRSDEAEQRGQTYDKMGVTYLFDLDHIIQSSEAYTIDAYRYGNISHFINHSCEPNLCVVNVWVDCLDPNLSRLALFALQDIEKGQEITIDYKFSANVPIEENVISADNLYNNEVNSKFKISFFDKFDSVDLLNKGYDTLELPDANTGLSNSNPTENAHSPNSKYMICKCGAQNCRKILRYY